MTAAESGALRERLMALVSDHGLHEGPCSKYDVKLFALAAYRMAIEDAESACAQIAQELYSPLPGIQQCKSFVADDCAATVRALAEGIE